MISFATAADALKKGARIRRTVWEAVTTMFVEKGTLVCQRGDAAPYAYDLSWFEIDANDWAIVTEP